MIKLKDMKTKAAKVILEEFKDIINTTEEDFDIEFLLKDFDNGREQGYVIEVDWVNEWPVSTIHLAFAEHRNSDNIVIYEGKGHFYNNCIKEEFWGTAKCFKYNEESKAAHYIYNRLLQSIKDLPQDCEAFKKHPKTQVKKAVEWQIDALEQALKYEEEEADRKDIQSKLDLLYYILKQGA